MALAVRAKDPQAIVPAIVARVVAETVLDQADEAARLRTEVRALSATSGGHATFYIAVWWMAHAAGLSADYLDQLDRETPFGRAAGAFADGDPGLAADLFESMGAPGNEAYVRLLAAEQAIATGDRVAAERQLERALAFYREVRATYFIERAMALSRDITPAG
jgi:hypothetical protein